jgi:hypothetical protein
MKFTNGQEKKKKLGISIGDAQAFCYLCFIHFPNFPDLPCQIGAWFKSRFARFPASGSDFARGAYMLEGLDLPDRFGHFAADGWSQDLHGLDHKIGVDDKAAANIHTSGFIVNPENGADPPGLIAQHREGESALHHLGEFFFLPDFVGKTAVGAAS